MNTPADLSDDFCRLTDWESAVSWPLDRPRLEPPPTVALDPGLPGSARRAVDRTLREALAAGPCFVLFSGGRDSSALLAAAAAVARAEGLPDPVAVTARHPGDAVAEESDWQELVIRHLRLTEWVRLDFRGEQRLLGDCAVTALRRHGLVWPESVQVHGAIYRHLDAGASLVSGEGGDQLLTSRRRTALVTAAHHPRRALRAFDEVVPLLVPGPLGRAAARREIRTRGSLGWATREARERVFAATARIEREPLRWDLATQRCVANRPEQILSANFSTGVREYGLRPVNPFYDQRVIDALAREGGRRGLGNRTQLMIHLFGDVLPPEVVRRRTKASFTATRWGEPEREFARAWTGAGVDHDVVDAERLRADWLSPEPSYGADYQLHRAWLATHPTPEYA